jgi:hypothetical protein
VCNGIKEKSPFYPFKRSHTPNVNNKHTRHQSGSSSIFSFAPALRNFPEIARRNFLKNKKGKNGPTEKSKKIVDEFC